MVMGLLRGKQGLKCVGLNVRDDIQCHQNAVSIDDRVTKMEKDVRCLEAKLDFIIEERKRITHLRTSNRSLKKSWMPGADTGFWKGGSPGNCYVLKRGVFARTHAMFFPSL